MATAYNLGIFLSLTTKQGGVNNLGYVGEFVLYPKCGTMQG